MAASNAPGLFLPPSAVNQLERLIEYIDRTDALIGEINSAELGITVFEVLRPLSERLDIPLDHLEAIIYALENLRYLETEYGSADEAFVRIVGGVPDKIARKLEANKSAILAALAAYSPDNPISTTFKAQKLSYLYERVFRGAEIITDIRPVFDFSGERVLEVIVAHTLIVTHSETGGTERLHFAMDAGDVLSLRRACDRAITKANALRSLLTHDTDIKVQILRGDEENVSS
jgi:hypothetical protein